MQDLAAKFWVGTGTAGPSQSSQHCILGLVGHIFVVFCAQEQSCTNKHGSSQCLHICWQGRMSAGLFPHLLSWDFISQTTPGCQVSIQLMSPWVHREPCVTPSLQKVAVPVCKTSLKPELQPGQTDGHAQGMQLLLSLELMKAQSSREPQGRLLCVSQPQLCAAGFGEGELLAARQSSGVFQCKKIRRRRETPTQTEIWSPAGSFLPDWLNPQSSPAPCHCTRRLGDTLALSLGWEEMRAACPQQPPAYTAAHPGTQQTMMRWLARRDGSVKPQTGDYTPAGCFNAF